MVRVAKGGTDDVENLVDLDKACHRQVHSNKPKLNNLR
ncbi:hypothetical protein [Microseira sp. BLCC-F43]